MRLEIVTLGRGDYTKAYNFAKVSNHLMDRLAVPCFLSQRIGVVVPCAAKNKNVP